MAVLSAPCQGNELQKQTAAHQREMALDMLSEIANVFDFPDLNRFLSVSWAVLFTFDLFFWGGAGGRGVREEWYRVYVCTCGFLF